MYMWFLQCSGIMSKKSREERAKRKRKKKENKTSRKKKRKVVVDFFFPALVSHCRNAYLHAAYSIGCPILCRFKYACHLLL